MNKIPTAEGFYLNPNSYITKKMIEFAKLHVEAALKAAAGENYPSTKANFKLVNNKILKAYPLENIK